MEQSAVKVMPTEAEARANACAGDGATRFHLEPLTEGRAVWDELLNTCPGVTLYHRVPWIDLLSRAYGLSLWLASLHQDGRVAAGCVFARSPLSRRFTSLSFSDSCPPLAKEPGAVLRLLDALIAHAPPHRRYEVRGIAGVAQWQSVQCFANWRLRVDRPLAQIEKGLAANFRRNLRRASQHPITIERGSSVELLERFYGMQLESRRRLGLPPQPWRFFGLTREVFAADGNFEVWTARESGKDVASALFLRDDDVIHYKWGARRADDRSSANHLLFWNAIEEFAPRARVLDLGRADVRNQGLTRFKAELGATAAPLPYSFYPRAPSHLSAEVLTGTRAMLAGIWSQMPMFATRLAGQALYRFLG